METAAVAEELPGTDELDELYRLDASETEPEDEDLEDDEDDEDDDDYADEDEDEGGVEPRGIPHP
jgi:hypothetical protein